MCARILLLLLGLMLSGCGSSRRAGSSTSSRLPGLPRGHPQVLEPICGISGYRSPQHSVAGGGFADDPHTRGEAEDVGVGSLLRSSAAQIPEAELARFGLYRPFDPSDDPSNPEVSHLQLIPASGGLTLAQAQASFDPDPNRR
jgi:hypothetical protein